MRDASAILQESKAVLERVKGLEEAVGGLFSDYPNLRALARDLVEAAQMFAGGLKVTAAPMMEAGTASGRPSGDGAGAPRETAAPASLGAVQAPGPAESPGAGGTEAARAADAPGVVCLPDRRAAEAGRAVEQAVEQAEEPGEPRSVLLAGKLAEIAWMIEQDNLVVDVNDFRFAQKARELVVGFEEGLEEGLDEEERGGQKAARVLFDCVRFMDVLDRDYSLPGYERLGETVNGLRREVAEFLKEKFDIEFSPDPCAPGSESSEALAGLQAKRVNFPSNEPAGKALAVRKRGARLPGGTEPPELLVSTGSATPAFSLAHDVARAVLAPAKLPPKLRQGRAAAAKEIRHKYLSQLVDADEEREATVLRYVANVLQAINKEGALKDLMRPILAALEERGYRSIPVRAGGMFDDSYSTSKYERKSMPSSQPKGTIVEALQIGFVNRDGVPVQKAHVGVSSGMPAG